MKTASYNLKATNGEIEIIVIADTHIGANFNEALLRETIDYILEKENCYCILDGDILDCAIIGSRGNAYESEMTPSAALSYAHLLLKPLADAGKILCMCGGNHDADRMMRETDINASMELAVRLGVQDRYSKDSYILFLRVKGGIRGNSYKTQLYKIFVSHGRNGGGGRLAGSKANALEQMSLVVPNADVYIHAHSHFPMTYKDNYYILDDNKSSVFLKERMFVNVNSFLHYSDSYGEAKLYKPTSHSIPRIKLKSYRICRNHKDHIYKTISCEI